MIEQIFSYGIGPVIGGFVGWFFTRKKQNQEVKSSELDNVEAAIKIWREMSESLKTEVQDLRRQLAEINGQNEELLKRLGAVEKDYSGLLKNYKALKNKLK